MSVRKGSSTVASRLLVKVISVPSGDHAGPMSSLGWLVRLVSPLPSRFTAQISHGSQQPPTWLCFMNTTFVLSGDQSGARSSPSKLSPVKIASFWPLVSIVTISHPWFLTPASAILVPSGDQAGSLSLASVSVRLIASSVVGSVSITKTSGCSEKTWPGISLTKTIWVPDGDQEGWYSWKLSASGVSGVLVRLVWLEPSASITQMSVKSPTSSWSLVKAILVPSEDQAGWPSLVSGVLVRLVWLEPSASITQMSEQACPKQCSLGSVPGLTKTILPSGEVVWAEASVEARALAKNNSAIDAPSKIIARLVPSVRRASCMMSLLSGGHHAALPARVSRMMIIPVGVWARASSNCTRAYKRTVWI